MTLDDTLTAFEILLLLCGAAALIILWAGAYLMICRAIEAHRHLRGRHHTTTTAEQDQAAIDEAGHHPEPMLDAIRHLHDACCERWWTTLNTHHDPTCPNHTRKETR
ncbi:hypothetical protein [Streptomyces sp. bgisy027]|uniref:hypothetical protein n=1 Tax=Streptomyces sp. bgisy027 TaxID=3413770 RepID=UPI003D760D86